jgi:hypothetical protein
MGSNKQELEKLTEKDREFRAWWDSIASEYES